MNQTPTSSPRLLQLLQQGLARLTQAESEVGLVRQLDHLLQELPGVAFAMLTVVDHLPPIAAPSAAPIAAGLAHLRGQQDRSPPASRTWLLALPPGAGPGARTALVPMPALEFPIRQGLSGMLCVYSDPLRPPPHEFEAALLDALRILTLTLGAQLARLMPHSEAVRASMGAVHEVFAPEPTPPGRLAATALAKPPEAQCLTRPGGLMDRRTFMAAVDAHLQAANCLEAALLRVDVGEAVKAGELVRCAESDYNSDCRYSDRHALIEALASTLPLELPRACLRPGEFAVLLAPGLLGPASVSPGLSALEATVRLSVLQELALARVHPQVSLAVWPRDGVDVQGLLRCARAQLQGSGAMAEDRTVATAERVSMESELRRLVADGRLADEMRVVYQPQVGLIDMRLCGVEALLRWRSPCFGEVAPAVFMPLLEETGLIVQVGAWVVCEACRQVRRWAEMGVSVHRLAVNLSAGQLRSAATSRALEQVLVETGLMAWCQLEVEVTESTLMSDTDNVVDQLRALTGLGVRVAVDDFGRGTCALGWLESFPISGIKVDPLFLGGLDSNPDHAQLARAMFDLGRALNLRVSAEGVETASQLDFIRSNGCEEAQGYYFARPLEAEHFLVSTRHAFH